MAWAQRAGRTMYVRATPRETHGAPHNRSILMTPFLKRAPARVSRAPGTEGGPTLENGVARHDLTLEI